MQGVGHNDDKVTVLAATKTPYALDRAVWHRFDKRIYTPLANFKARQYMFKVLQLTLLGGRRMGEGDRRGVLEFDGDFDGD